MNDILTQNLLASARRLMDLMNEKLASKVLEIELSAESARNFSLLTRLIRSLDQYVSKERDIKYVGLVGHYSSGKSSTINSLLDLSKSADKRDTGLNPTDKAITLITHPRNSALLIMMSREGVAVPIRTAMIEHEALQDIVVSDTPGSGDPDVINELIQDFLPICDMVFYFIAATNPIDQADLPLLSQKATKLPFLPLSFIITRADEFRIDRSQVLTEGNLDTTKRNGFTGKLIARLSQALDSNDITPEDFIFIDNEANYNIDVLKHRILGSTNLLDQKKLIEMHAHKVEYYRLSLNTIFDYFVLSIDEKLVQCSGFVKTARENIARFDKSVELNSEKLKILWARSENTFREAYNEEKRNLEEIALSYYTIKLASDKTIISDRKALAQIVDQQTSGYIGKITGDINVALKHRLREVKHNILDNLEKYNLIKSDLADLFPLRLDFGQKSETLDVDLAKFNEIIEILSDHAVTILNDTKSSIRHRISLLKTNASKEIQPAALIQEYEKGRIAIFDAFDQYFDRIEMYQSAVLTKNTKETIEKLRIGLQLDALDAEFSDGYIFEIKEEAINDVYSAFEPEVDKFKKEIEKFMSTTNSLRNEVESIAILKNDYPARLGKENIDVSTIANEIVRQKEQSLNIAYEEKLINTLDIHRNNFKKHIELVAIKRKARKKMFLALTLVVLTISIACFVTYRYSNLASPNTTIGEIAISIGSTILFEGLVLIFIHFRYNLKKIMVNSERDLVKKSKSDIIHAFNESFWDDMSRKVEEKIDSNGGILRIRIISKVDPLVNEILQKRQVTQDELLAVFSKIASLVSQYKSSAHAFHNKFITVFSQSEKNSEKISLITKRIKEHSIKPSFELLEETTKDLETVKQDIINARIS